MFNKSLQNVLDRLYQYLLNKDFINYTKKEMNKKLNKELFKSSTVGLVTGLNQLVTFPISMPTHIISTLYIQLKSIMIIAHSYEHELDDENTKCLVYLCLGGKKAFDIVDQEHLNAMINHDASDEVITRVKKSIIMNLLNGLQSQQIKDIIQMIPIAGGLFGATVDLKKTKEVIETSKKIFQPYII